jgi:hypothetical protein
MNTNIETLNLMNLKERLADLEQKHKDFIQNKKPKHFEPSDNSNNIKLTKKIPDHKIEAAMTTSDKPLISGEMGISKSVNHTVGPVGLDIGTSHIVLASDIGEYIKTIKQLNAFFTVPASKFTKNTLLTKNILFFELNSMLYITGYTADSFANMFNTNTKRPIEKGMLSAREGEGIAVIASIINSLTCGPKIKGETICFSVPGQPIDDNVNSLYHVSVINQHLASLGYSPISINEGLAIVMSELAEEDFTGIGISMGGGMCNVCFSYLSVPVITYSIRIGGDYVDHMTSQSIGIPATKIKAVKENSLDLINPAKDRVSSALSIFYEDLIVKLVKSIRTVISTSENLPMLSQSVPIVLSGGSAMPNGVVEIFENILKKINFSIEISSVRLASDPLNTTAKGALIMALTEKL